ncbi:MAG TPA: hypothetical protein V6C65_40990 [Allocoleopsis sp.]
MDIGEQIFDTCMSHGKPLAFVSVFVVAFSAGALLFAGLWALAAMCGFVSMAAVLPGAVGCGIGCAIVPAFVCAKEA